MVGVYFRESVVRGGDYERVRTRGYRLVPRLSLDVVTADVEENDDKMKIGWFLHTPFPSSEIYRTLPMREELLISVLKADLVGFHTYDYARHSCPRVREF